MRAISKEFTDDLDVSLILSYLLILFEPHEVYFKFDFLRGVIDYEHYIQLNIPLPFHIVTIQELSKRLWYIA